MILDDLRKRWQRAAEQTPRAPAIGPRRVRRRDPSAGEEGLTWLAKTPRSIKIVTKNFGVADSHKLAVYHAARRLAGASARRWRCRRRRSSTRSRSRTCAAAAAPASRPGMKWRFIPKDAKHGLPGRQRRRVRARHLQGPRALACDPHLLIEGMIIASYALGCKHAYIYIRGEMMREDADRSQAAIDEAYAARLPRQGHQPRQRRRSSCDITLHRGAGAYICGEETALLNSLEGKRGWPRLKPPFPAVKGLFGSRRSSTTSRR